MKKSLIILVCFLLNDTAFSQLVGEWKGTLEIQGAKLRIVFHIQKADDKFTATFDSPDQNAYRLSVEEVLFNESQVNIKIPLIGANYNGKMNNDNKKILGTFEQGGLSIPLNLELVESLSSKSDRPQTTSE